VTGAVHEGGEPIAIDAEDRAHLVALHDLLAPQFSAIADAFDAAALDQPRTAARLASPRQVAELRAALIDWMSTGLLGPYDDAFYARRSKIGPDHAEIGLDARDLVLALDVVRRAYRERIAAAYAPAQVLAARRAVDRLLDLELAVMLRNYQRDAAAKLVASERQRRLEQVEAMQTLCAGLAHEVRNPLNSAKLQLQLATRRLRRGGDDPRLVEPIELAEHEIDRLTVLLDEFLAFARPPALDAHSYDVTSLVRDVIAQDRPLAVLRGAALSQIAPATPILAEVDAVKLRQVVDSLVCNAIEAVSAGGQVSVAVEDLDDHVHIRVTDDGPGIPADVLPRIYEPFFSTKEGGTGMGMSIAHSLVALHRGSIDVASSPRGTTVRVAVPRRQRALG
jgi:two-component system, NtrC family, sensor histidine kinase HydH